MTGPAQHEVGIRTDLRPRSSPGVGRDEHVPVYQAHCETCGWEGDETLSEHAAREEADEHVIETSRPAR